ncbi:MAG: EAL domain-containing protein [Magnetococcales bacterium]|nr:EAL domain-containing protein [Magnetococcales bacterium]
MNKLLARQIKRCFELGKGETPDVLAELRHLGKEKELSHKAAALLSGLSGFFERVNASYEQNERDLSLLHRSSQSSSDELSHANERLRSEIAERNHIEQELRRSEATTRAVLETAVNSIIVIDADKTVRMFNPAAEQSFGYAASEILGQNVRVLMPEPYRAEHDAYVDNYLDTGVRKVLGIGREVVGQRRDGTVFPAELFVSEMQVTDTRMFVGIIHDISERKQAEETLLLSRKVFENAGEAILITNAEGHITDVNPAYERITGYRREEVLGKNPNITKSGRHDQAFYQDMWNRLTQEGHWEGEVWDRRKGGEVFPKWVSISAIRNHSGLLTHYVAIFLDISDRKDAEQRLEQLAFYDALTSLPNRLFFRDRLAQAITQARRQETQMALMFIDLDRFKWVNDNLGHAAGDELLKEISQRLKLCVRDSDTVARLGGDEFTIILTDVNGPENAARVAEKLIASVRKPVMLSEQNVHVGASVGIAIFPKDADDLDTLVKFADMAMYQAKGAGRNTFRFVSGNFQAQAHSRMVMEDNLHQALERQELIPYYQPKLHLSDNRLIGAEALVRWVKPDGKLVSPGQFIPLAEEIGLILPIGQRMLAMACRHTVLWTRERACPFQVAVNISSKEFQETGLIKRIVNALEESGLPAERLEIEITESMVIGNVEKAIGVMKGLRNFGISLAMDDFGTGYSALGYLSKFPLNTLKIDQSFVRDLPDCHGNGAVVETVINLAHALKMKVVAEGVETAEQMEYLRQKGCDTIQGYLFGKPMPEAEFFAFYQRYCSGVAGEKPDMR